MGLSDYVWGPMLTEQPDSDAFKSPLQQIPEGIRAIGASFAPASAALQNAFFSPRPMPAMPQAPAPFPTGAMSSFSNLGPDAQQALAEGEAEEAETKKKKAKDSLVPPELQEVAKAGKVKDPDMEMMQTLISKNINPYTDPKRFLSYFGATAEQSGIARTWGPLDRIREIVSPDYQSLKARQAGLLEVGKFFTREIMKLQADRGAAPKTMGEAQAVVPGIVAPTPDQIHARPMANPAEFGPGLPAINPNARLAPYQQDLAGMAMKNLASGHITPNPETGVLEPTSIQAMQGRKVDPSAQVQIWQGLEDQGIVPPGTVEAMRPHMGLSLMPQNVNSMVSAAVQNKTQGAHQLSVGVRDYLAAKGLPHTPANINQAREAIKAENAAIERQKQLYKAGSDQQSYLAARLYNKMPYELTPDEAKVVGTKEAERAAKLASYEKAATIDTLNETQKLNEASHFWLDSKGNPARTDMTRAEASRAGYKPVPPSALDAVAAARSSKHILAEYKDVIKKVLVKATGNTITDLGKIKLNQLSAWIKGNAGDADVQRLDALNSNLAMYSRALGDTANIAVAEQIMRLAALPNWNSTQESAMEKLTSLERILDNVISARGLPVNQDLNSYYKPNKSLPVVNSDADYDKLAPGTVFVDSSGKQWTKPEAK